MFEPAVPSAVPPRVLPDADGAAFLPHGRSRSFRGATMCGIEWDEWQMVEALVRPSHVVLEFGARYGTASGSAFAAAGSSLGLAPQDDLRLQFGKLAHGLHTSRYVEMLQARRKALQQREAEAAAKSDDGIVAGGKKDSGAGGKDKSGGGGGDDNSEEEVYVSPGTLRTLLGKGHADFAGPGQQDAEDFLRHLLDLFERSATQQYVDPEEDLSRLFRFSFEERLQTDAGQVRYKTSADKVLRLRIPTDRVDNAADVAAYAEREALRAAGAMDEGKNGGGGEVAAAGHRAAGPRRRALAAQDRQLGVGHRVRCQLRPRRPG